MAKIINGEPVTNKTMLDSLFNTYAPALNAGLAQTGFNSLVEMRNAVQAGNNINVPNFIQGFSNGLSVIQDMCIEKPSKYGEEIPIDVVTELKYTYTLKTPTQEVLNGDNIEKYINNLKKIKCQLTATIKNENAELWQVNDFNTKIINIMNSQKAITFRVGKSIYEDCIIETYAPTVQTIHSFTFISDIRLSRNSIGNSYQNRTKRIMKIKPPVGDFDKINYNLAAKEVYGGIIS